VLRQLTLHEERPGGRRLHEAADGLERGELRVVPLPVGRQDRPRVHRASVCRRCSRSTNCAIDTSTARDALGEERRIARLPLGERVFVERAKRVAELVGSAERQIVLLGERDGELDLVVVLPENGRFWNVNILLNHL